jgi:hypothetical protein
MSYTYIVLIRAAKLLKEVFNPCSFSKPTVQHPQAALITILSRRRESRQDRPFGKQVFSQFVQIVKPLSLSLGIDLCQLR